jgi:hypothetical protein
MRNVEHVMRDGFWLTLEASDRLDAMADEVADRAAKRAKANRNRVNGRIHLRKIRGVARRGNGNAR